MPRRLPRTGPIFRLTKKRRKRERNAKKAGTQGRGKRWNSAATRQHFMLVQEQYGIPSREAFGLWQSLTPEKKWGFFDTHRSEIIKREKGQAKRARA